VLVRLANPVYSVYKGGSRHLGSFQQVGGFVDGTETDGALCWRYSNREAVAGPRLVLCYVQRLYVEDFDDGARFGHLLQTPGCP